MSPAVAPLLVSVFICRPVPSFVLLAFAFATDSPSFLRVSLSLHSAHGVVEESCDRGVLSAGGVGAGGGVRAVLQIQER